MRWLGDFDAFRWGLCEGHCFKVIEFGNPDNAENGDLQATGQVMLVGEAYIGFGILTQPHLQRLFRQPQFKEN